MSHAAAADLTPPPDGDVNKGHIVLNITYSTTAIALFIVAVRLWVRIRVVKSVGWDDYIIVLASALAVVVLAFEVLSVNHGNGRHSFYLSEYDKVQASKWSRMTIAPNLTACMLARVSLCIFLLRIVNRQKAYKIFLWGIICLTSLATMASIINLLASCQPIEKMWNPKHPGKCISQTQTVAFGMTQAATSILFDFLLAMFPILILRNLNMALKTKIALGILMGMGLFVSIVTLIKTKEVYTLGRRTDITWSTFYLTCFSILEQNVGIICVSIPACRPLFSRFFKIGSSYAGGWGESPKPYNEARTGYDLGNMSGRKKGPLSYPNTVHVSAVGTRPGVDDNGSESSLVGKRNLAAERHDGRGITKTVSVSMKSYTYEGKG